MEKRVSFQVEDVIEVPEWASSYPEEKFTVYKCCFLSTKENSHGIPISDAILRKCAKSILGTWLVAKIEYGDSTTHDVREQIYGTFPIGQDIEFVEEDGITKAFAYAVVSKRYSKEFNGIFEYDNFRNGSVEMRVSYSDPDDENSVDGFDIEALTCLGRTVNGSCPDANIQMVRFSKEDAEAFFNKQETINFEDKEDKEMEAKSYKVDKSKEAMSTKPWGEVDKTDLRNKIMEATNKSSLVKDVYMLVEDGWEDAPSEHLKYPVMCFEGDTLVYNRYGLSSALAYATQENEQSVINKIKAIYKKLDIDDDSERKEEKDMAEIEFSAVNIGDLWGKLYTAMRDLRHWDYSIKGIYEQDNQKFAVVYDDDMKLYRLNFSLTEEGLSLSDEIIEVKEEFIETDNMKKFAEPEDVEKYRNGDKEIKTEEHDDIDDEDDDEQLSIEQLKSRIEELEKEIENKEHIIMENEAQLKELNDFKCSVEEKEKIMAIESLMCDVADYLDPETMSTMREEGMACKFSEIDGWSNKVKALCFNSVKKQPKKKSSEVWGFASPIESQKNKKSNSVWDRI